MINCNWLPARMATAAKARYSKPFGADSPTRGVDWAEQTSHNWMVSAAVASLRRSLRCTSAIAARYVQ